MKLATMFIVYTVLSLCFPPADRKRRNTDKINKYAQCQSVVLFYRAL
jgi:hypothetical protein